jgi:hypothetical protein
MKILMHLCCGPCSIYPVRVLQEEGAEVMGFFYKNNIHPYSECLRRQEALEKYAAQINLRVIYQEGYDLEGFIQNLVHREADRCRHCYHDRLRTTALLDAVVQQVSEARIGAINWRIHSKIRRSSIFLSELSRGLERRRGHIQRIEDVPPAVLRVYLQ